MKKIFLLSIAVYSLYTTAFTQGSLKRSWNLGIHAGSGFSQFKGSAVAASTRYHISDVSSIPGFPENVFGSNANVFLLVGGKLYFPYKSRVRLITDLQYERVRTKLDINQTISNGGPSNVDGEHTQTFHNISINPSLGFYFGPAKIKHVIHAGFDYSINVARKQRSVYSTMQGANFSHENNESEKCNDLRLTAGFLTNLRRFGIDISYKHGLLNQTHNPDFKAHVRIVQAKLMYYLK